MTRPTIVLLFIAALALASCNGSNNLNPAPTDGSIAGELTLLGPINGALELQVGAFTPGSETPVQSAVAGRVTSAATATLSGRTISYSFTELSFGSYEIGVFAAAGAENTFFYRSDTVTISEEDPDVADADASFSFTGNAPFGTVSGIVLLEEGFEFAPGNLAFVGVNPVGQPQAVLQHLVSAADVNSQGQLFFNLEGIAYGNYNVGFYSYNPATHAVTPLGLLDDAVTVSASAPNITGAIFPAADEGDPGADPELGSISGTVTFNGELPEGASIFVGANTVPPQQGAPPATVEVFSADIAENGTLEFVLPGLPEGGYAVAIFSYNFVTHQATYFGQVENTVAVGNGENVTGADFDADVTLIGGTAN